MTAELADCFATKREGVNRILSAVERWAGHTPTFVWQTSGDFVSTGQARDRPLAVAAANWHALATYVARLSSEPALLIDIGTTTTDIIFLSARIPRPIGLTDRQRLQSGELVYTGVKRTPLCAVAPSVTLRGAPCALAAELFATMLDVYLWLGDLREDPADIQTANGRPATKADALDRLARCVCCDREEFSSDDADAMCAQLARAQQRQIQHSLERVLAVHKSAPRRAYVSGIGAFRALRCLAELERTRASEVVLLSDLFGTAAGEAACAFAIACLAADRSRSLRE